MIRTCFKAIVVMTAAVVLWRAQYVSPQYDETQRQIAFVTDRIRREGLPDAAGEILRGATPHGGSIIVMKLYDRDGWGQPLIAVYVQPPGGTGTSRVWAMQSR
jgi:hypothetical protein